MKHYLDKKLLNSPDRISILVIGCGGTGSHVLSCLARINEMLEMTGKNGITVTAYDDDIVNDHNQGRQLFYKQDIGRNKAEVLIGRINQTYGYDWIGVPVKYKVDNSHRFDIIISCVDKVQIRKDINKMSNWFYFQDYGNSRDTGQVILGHYKHELPTVIDMYPDLKDDEDEPSCSAIESLSKQQLFINSTLANLGCNMIWQLLSEYYIEYRGLYLNLSTGTVKSIEI